ncbi:MAG: LysR family transcriptional regulator [Holosporales bacterium]|jgi:DNA-binding transcriptional LysR family regulator|nr:LysR family transcriptional regulator [Holosporales bacterium]
MDIFEIKAFVNTCESGSQRASKMLGRSEIDVCLAIEKLQSFVAVDLFSDNLAPSKDTLTDSGRIYYGHAKIFLENLRQCVLDVLRNYENTLEGVPRIKISMCSLIGKEILADSLSSLSHNFDLSNVCIDLSTSDDVVSKYPLKYHAIFGDPVLTHKDFFQIRWSANVTQGLYASENYIRDVGMPRSVDDLINHSIIMYGNSFRDVCKSKGNWYLSKLPEINPAIIVNNLVALFAAINADLGIGSSFCYRSKHLRKVLPEISGPVVTINFAVRVNIPDKLMYYINAVDKAVRDKLQATGIELKIIGENDYV